VVTTVGFHRVRHFQTRAGADQGKVSIEHGTLSVDGDSRPLGKLTAVELHPDSGSTILARVVSPTASAPSNVILRAEKASQTLVDGDDKTPDQLERLPGVAIALLVPWAVYLLGAATRLSIKLWPWWRRNDAEAE
jgi:hypothetical protein